MCDKRTVSETNLPNLSYSLCSIPHPTVACKQGSEGLDDISDLYVYIKGEGKLISASYTICMKFACYTVFSRVSFMYSGFLLA